MLCTIEKNGLTVQQKLAQRIHPDPNPQQPHAPSGLRFAPEQFGVPLSYVRRVMRNDSWVRATRPVAASVACAFTARRACLAGSGAS